MRKLRGKGAARRISLVACAGLALLSVCAWGAGEETSGPVAVSRDMVWADYEGAHRNIYYSAQEQGGTWSEPKRISDGKTDSLLPCIVTAPSGTKFVVWTVIDDGRLSIRYALFDGEGWSEPRTAPGLPRDATMPFVAADDAGAVWLVFAGNDGAGQDDIYCARLKDGEWSKPERVNAPNEVPDILPFIEIGSDGAVQVTWSGFRNRGYTQLGARWENGEWTAEEPLSQDDQDAMEQNRKRFAEEKLPGFVQDRSMLFIRGNDR